MFRSAERFSFTRAVSRIEKLFKDAAYTTVAKLYYLSGFNSIKDRNMEKKTMRA